MRFEVYEDKRGQWRWRLRAANGKLLASPGQGFASRQACEKSVSTIQMGAVTASVVGPTDG